MQVIFWTEDNFCFISDCKNSFNCKLKKFINKQIIIFYSPSNALCLSGKSVKYHTVKQLNIIFSLVCVLFPPSQICKYWISVNKDTMSLKNIHREKTHSNKTPTLFKSMNMDIWVVSTSNQLFVRVS